MTRLFECWLCGRRFSTEQTDEEVLAEMRQRFGDVPENEQESLCDECHVKHMDRVLSRVIAGIGRPPVDGDPV